MEKIVIYLISAIYVSSCSYAAEQRPLESISVYRTEFGMLKDPSNKGRIVGSGKMDMELWGQKHATFWANNRKIVKTVQNLKPLSSPDLYRSSMQDRFLVGRKPVTGIGMWLKTRNMYHEVEFPIPKGCTLFTANLLVSDDPGGYSWSVSSLKKQEFHVQIFLDDQKVSEQLYTRMGLKMGTGQQLQKLSIPIIGNPERLRFYIYATNAVEANHNIELIIHKGIFHIPNKSTGTGNADK